MTTFVWLKPKIYNYLTDNNFFDKKLKGIKKHVTKSKTKLKDYKNCQKANRLESKCKNNIVVDKLEENQKKFVKDNRLI